MTPFAVYLHTRILILRQQAELEQAADKPGTVQHHKKVTAAIKKQLDERKEKQAQLEAAYTEKKQEYTQLREELGQVSTLVYSYCRVGGVYVH